MQPVYCLFQATCHHGNFTSKNTLLFRLLLSLDLFSLPMWPLGPLSQHDAFILMTCSSLMLLAPSGSFWGSPGTTALSSGSSGSSPGLLGEFCQVLPFERSWTCSKVFCSFFDFFWTSLTLSDTADASISCPGSPGSTFVLPDEHFQHCCSEDLLTHTDVVHSFIGCFQLSPSSSGAPNTSTLPLTGSMSQFKAALLSPSSLTLRDSVCRGAGLSGGFSSSDESLDSFAGHPRH